MTVHHSIALAFPTNFQFVDENGITQHHIGHGMLLRDYFAAQALVAVAAFLKRDVDEQIEDPATLIARHAYLLADAMLAERSK